MKTSNKYIDFFNNLNEGNVCIFETDTVVGIACSVWVNNSINKNIKRIFDIKNRSLDKALPWMVSSQKMLKKYTKDINQHAQEIINNKWPGSTTIVLKCNTNVPSSLSVKCNNIWTVAFRIPNSKDIINAINQINIPIVCTSANFSGKAPVCKIDKLEKKLVSLADFVYSKNIHNGNDCAASTIVSCVENKPIIIRN